MENSKIIALRSISQHLALHDYGQLGNISKIDNFRDREIVEKNRLVGAEDVDRSNVALGPVCRDDSKSDEKVILFVDDDSNIAELLANSVRRHGFKTLYSNRSHEVLNELGDKHVDVAVLDVMMPKVSGLELAEKLSECGTKIILLTAVEQKKPKWKTLIKPQDIPDLVDAIKGQL